MSEDGELNSALAKLRLQDVVVIIVCLASVAVFQAPYNFELKPLWKLNVPQPGEPSPLHVQEPLSQGIIDDIDEDGINEFLVFNNIGHIQVFTFPPDDESKEDESSILPHLNLKTEISLSNETNQGGHSVLSMSTGCLSEIEGSCEKILITLTRDLRLHCFDGRLKHLWTSDLFKEPLDLSQVLIRKRSLLVVPRNYWSGEDGLIVVAFVLEDTKHFEQKLEHDHETDFTVSQTAENLLKKIRGIDPTLPQESPKKDARLVNGNLFTFVLSGKSGEITWRYSSEEASQHPNQFQKNLFSGHHFKLQLHHQTYHKGEVPWRKYKRSILSSLPYRWDSPSDTVIHLGHFQKERQADRPKEGESFLEAVKQSLGKSSSVPFLLQTSQTQVEPNAVVVHSDRGIDVLNLNTGQLLCRLESKGAGTSLGDVNGDGELDYVETNFNPAQSPDDIPYCSTVVKSGHSTPLFNGSICQPSFLLSWLEEPADPSRVELSAMSPLLIPDVHIRSGIFNHLMGHTLPRSAQGYDSVFYISNGKITCFGSHGEFHWQAATMSSWPSNRFPPKPGGIIDFIPSIKKMSLQVQGVQDSLVVVGWSNMAVVSLLDGKILAEHSLPCQAINPVLVSDFNNDGWTDLVIQCNTGFVGFTIDRYPGHWYTAVFVGVILLIMVSFVLLLRFIDLEDIEENQPKGPKVS